jgi:hypothetical protein
MSDVEKQQRIETVLRYIATAVEGVIKHEFGEMGFAIILFDFYKPGIGNYISNARRHEMIKALRESADRLENNEDIPAVKTNIQ